MFKKINISKKIIVLTLVLVLAVGGFFLWWQSREIKGSPEDYVIKETEKGRVVENERVGLRIQVPKGWMSEKIEFLEGSIIMYTTDVESERQSEVVAPPLKNGCGIEVAVAYKEVNFDEIKKEIEEVHVGIGIKSEKFETVTINDHKALKNTFDSVSLGPGISVYFSQKNKLYSFVIYWGLDEKERCTQEFDKFLETVSIE